LSAVSDFVLIEYSSVAGASTIETGAGVAVVTAGKSLLAT